MPTRFPLMWRGRRCRILPSHPLDDTDGGRYVRIQFAPGRRTAIVDNEELTEAPTTTEE